MNYLALARKWRPRKFSELVGQEHVVRALSNALDTQRIHHAWLFTGTRGVGKTTLARILAKSLNCETGITAAPCGQCSACLEIDQGRFVDYIEVDAASRRGVDEITPLLEQAIYAPSRGRFKIYTIDEVHMLTTHAFNAMLKTLEEPPAHLKFILATTDPQKIPVTVLSRCIQYNLKQMAPEAVIEHLQHLLSDEGVQYESAALQLIARGAAGSMRDALSLTDQAIAFSGNHITVEAMQDMLGAIDQSYLLRLVNALLAGDASQVVSLADAIAERGFSYEGALADLAIVLSRIAMEQRLAGTLDSDDPLYPDMMQVVQSANHDLLQLFYTIAVHGRKELALAPDEYAGFVMICLRMLALVNTPVIQGELSQPRPGSSVSDAPIADEEDKKKLLKEDVSSQAEQLSARTYTTAPGTEPDRQEVADEVYEAQPETIEKIASADVVVEEEELVVAAPAVNTVSPAIDGESVPTESVRFSEPHKEPHNIASSERSEMSDADWDRIYDSSVGDYDGGIIDAPLSDSHFELGWEPHATESDNKISLANLNQERWIELTKRLNLPGLAGELLLNSQWLATDGNTLHLKIFLRNVDELSVKSTLTTALTEYFSQVVKLDFKTGETGDATARAQLIKEQEERQRQAEELVANDPYIKSLQDNFGAIVVDGSVQVLSNG
ncbi:DNA polymerase III subunit tau [Oligella ureolytica]|uniref:DNA polymerase III subunit gamma/tau n=1 Tax=Oligella ureolytica TaxID=90244 RepID=A0A378XCR5_9BURK|nr:DNA polymerase III subunit gamma/tau [Oligella ureolytica]QPT40652.1 DNA polymerase III subunit gamma/tau [Oligella ureolytica]SUA52346.1 DNA polymerase III subunit tau [Oligella ureolytica]SUA58657.1 DNA polymerase III subunit tau [Oligella ureolytica]